MGRARWILAGLFLLALGVFLSGINWGLPTRRVDRFLFGDHPVWTGEQIAQLAGERDPAQKVGADVDVDPLSQDHAKPIILNATDQQRAQIIRRYRLYSYQPDEMITFMALSTIKQNRGDPRLYQYGGLWIYPVGALIKVVAEPQASQAYYLDHPEEFGRFYIIARLYVVAWGLVGVWAVFRIARTLGADLLVAATATSCFILMPAVVNMAHEAKPHLPGAVLILLAIIAATKYVETGFTKWWVIAGALCGAAFGMLLSAIVAFLILPTMTLFRPDAWGKRIRVTLASAACGLAVFAVTNPYVIVHLFHDREILESNLENSRAMYRAPLSLEGVLNASYLLSIGATPLLALLGGIFALRACRRKSATGWMLAVVSTAVLVQFALFATGKPAEHARFALLADIALGIGAVVGIGLLMRFPKPRAVALVALVLFTAIWGVVYVVQFVQDARLRRPRLVLAERLRPTGPTGQTIYLAAEPAPYSLPPVDLFRSKLLLGDRPPNEPGISISTADDLPAPMSWADKRFVIRP